MLKHTENSLEKSFHDQKAKQSFFSDKNICHQTRAKTLKNT